MITNVDIVPLAFDTQLFSLNVKSLSLPIDIAFSEVINSIEETNFDLLYIFSERSIETDLLQNKCLLELSYSDEKVIFSGAVEKLISSTSAVPIIVNAFESADFDDLKSLAFQSGEFSRFYLDQKLPKSAFEELYSTWLSKSLSKEYADDYFIAFDRQSIGLLTSKIKDGAAHIGLLAVDKHSRGRGIGQELLSQFAKKMKEKGIKKVVIPTQRINRNACKFYQALGLSECENKFIYHCWKNNG